MNRHPSAARVAELAAHAQALTEQAAAEQAELDRIAADPATLRANANRAWWAERERTLNDRLGGTIDKAWKAFETAVATGKDTVAAWLKYQTATATVHRERHEIAQHHYSERATAAHAKGVRFTKLTTKARDLANEAMAVANFGPEEYETRLEAWCVEASDYLGRTLTNQDIALDYATGIRPLIHLLGSQPQMPPAPPATRSQPPGGPQTYAEAVDKAVAAIADTAASETWAQAEQAREAHVDKAARPG